MSRTLIVTGDDFGLSSGVNAAIVAAHREGILTSASLMVTGDAVSEAASLARSLPALSTGLHLVLSGREARAASPPHEIPDLVDASGRFPASPAWAGISDVVFWKRRRAQMEREIRAQIERYLATGLPLDHVDGHHHLHMHPLVFDVLLARMEEYGIRWVRLVDEDGLARTGAPLSPGELVPAIFGLLSRRARSKLKRIAKVGAPERLYGLRATGRVRAATLLSLVPRIAASCVEIYAHPDRASAEGRLEEEALRAPAVRAAVEAAGFRLANTRELGAGEAAAA